MRCLQELGDPRDRRAITTFLEHPDPEVRIAAVNAVCAVVGADDTDLFRPLLADQSWWVRQAAADAVAALPGTNSETLAYFLSTVEDRYGRDALRRAIAEKGR